MKVLGIIAEYNPIHNGHIYHLTKCKEMSKADFVVAIMSGNFTQRGEPAIFDKWTRGRLAVDNGVDLVIELPFAFATGSAEIFAKGAVEILAGLGCVTDIAFGSESGNLEALKKQAEILKKEPDIYREYLKKNLKRGVSFPKARQQALMEIFKEQNEKEFEKSRIDELKNEGYNPENILGSPNNILAIEYLKALYEHPEIKAHTIKRLGNYNSVSLQGEFASAAAIREKNLSPDEISSYVPGNVAEEMKKSEIIPSAQMFWDLIQGTIFKSDVKNLAEISGVVEGLENKLKKEIRNHNSFEEFANAIKSKRYTRTAVNRALFHILMGLKDEDLNSPELYARILGVGEKGRELLRYMDKNETNSLPLITNINKVQFKENPEGHSKKAKENWIKPKLLEIDILASDIYNLAMGRDLYKHCDLTQRVYIRK